MGGKDSDGGSRGERCAGTVKMSGGCLEVIVTDKKKKRGNDNDE